MNTSEMNMKELTLDELEMADGGWSWKRAGKAAGLLGIVGAGCGAIIGFLYVVPLTGFSNPATNYIKYTGSF